MFRASKTLIAFSSGKVPVCVTKPEMIGSAVYLEHADADIRIFHVLSDRLLHLHRQPIRRQATGLQVADDRE